MHKILTFLENWYNMNIPLSGHALHLDHLYNLRSLLILLSLLEGQEIHETPVTRFDFEGIHLH